MSSLMINEKKLLMDRQEDIKKDWKLVRNYMKDVEDQADQSKKVQIIFNFFSNLLFFKFDNFIQCKLLFIRNMKTK